MVTVVMETLVAQASPMSSVPGAFSSSVATTITSASHASETLIRFGNVAYTTIHSQYPQVKYELGTDRYSNMHIHAYMLTFHHQKPGYTSSRDYQYTRIVPIQVLLDELSSTSSLKRSTSGKTMVALSTLLTPWLVIILLGLLTC